MGELQSSKRGLLMVVVAALLGASIVLAGEIAALVVPSIASLLVLLHLVKRVGTAVDDSEYRRRIRWWTVVSFLAHLLVASVITHGGLQLIFGPDAPHYHSGAQEIVRHWKDGLPLPSYLPAGKTGFYYLLAICYWVFGPHVSVGLVVNAALAAAIVPLMTDSTRRLFGTDAARHVPPLIVLIPGLFLWTAQLLKEAPILFLIAVAVYFAVRLVERVALAPLIGLGVAFVLLFTFRAWIGLVLAAGMIAGIVVDARQLVAALGRGIGVIAVVALFTIVLGLGYSGYEVAVNSDLEGANTVRQDLAAASTGYAADADISTPRGAVSYLFVGLPQFLFGPFPWQFSSARQLPVVPDVCVWWALLPATWRGLWECRRRPDLRASVLVLPAIGLTLLLTLAIGNFGTMVRERTQVTLLLIPLIALGLAVRKLRPPSLPPAAGSLVDLPTLAAPIGSGRPSA